MSRKRLTMSDLTGKTMVEPKPEVEQPEMQPEEDPRDYVLKVYFPESDAALIITVHAANLDEAFELASIIYPRSTYAVERHD